MIVILAIFSVSCQKGDHDHPSDPEILTRTYPADVLKEWIKLDLQLLRSNDAKLNNFVMVHHWAYSSIALYEALVPGMPSFKSLSGQLNEMPSMPVATHNQTYHWPTCANTVLAAMTRKFYHDSITQGGKDSITLLEETLNKNYQTEVDATVFGRSKAFGTEVADRIFKWALSDGFVASHPPYMIPSGDGQWQRTPPGLLAPQRLYWGLNRPLMAGSVKATQLPPPPAYSSDPKSAFYGFAKEVYDLRNGINSDGQAQVLFWRDVPGGGHAHWLSIFLQVLNQEGSRAMLDKAALVFAKMGITQSDARVSCWKAKYGHNLLRPVTYINAMIAPQKNWNSFITTPNHPEYPSAHSSFSAPAAAILSQAFGDNYAFTDHSYDFLMLPARSYKSFSDAAVEAGNSRVIGGLHYRFSVTAGNQLGEGIANYMNQHIRFKISE
ncbi:MAG: phosphatase PAP2 family protein [Chitinophagaceae bacterium]|nr:MAG: phosphatase PAP2 family protein [Chitinophagaceae bacterium]